MSELIHRIKNKTAVLGVIGLGYVGLPLAVEKAMAGYKTIGFDIQYEKVKMVNQGENYIGDVVGDQLKTVVSSEKLSATSTFSQLSNVDCVCICVPTPLDRHQQPNLRYVVESTKNIVPFLHSDMLVVLESTTYPGTTIELVKPILEESGLKCGDDFYLAFSPERVDPGNRLYKTKNTPKVVGGVTAECTKVAAALYESILEAKVYQVSSPTVAEMEKLLENTYRNINIALVNEFVMLCDRMQINLWEVIDAAKTKPYGFEAFYPGPGLGGHCIPLDPYYLTWKAREFGFHTSMIESAMMINDSMPDYCVERISRILNRFEKPLKGSNLLILGVAYKQDIDDYRESPAVKVIDLLKKDGAYVQYYDPYIPSYTYHGQMNRSINQLASDVLRHSDLIIITTAHTNVDYSMVYENAPYIFDTKNVMKSFDRDKIEAL